MLLFLLFCRYENWAQESLSILPKVTELATGRVRAQRVWLQSAPNDLSVLFLVGLAGRNSGQDSACNAGGTGGSSLIPGLERSPGEGNGNPLQYSCLENPVDRGACWATVHGVAKSQTQFSSRARAQAASWWDKMQEKHVREQRGLCS